MALYTYLAKDQYGHNIQEQAEAFNENQLLDSLYQRQLIVVSIKEAKGPVGLRTKKASGKRAGFDKKVKLFDMLLFTSQLSAMIDSGIPLLSSLRSLGKEMKNKELKQVVEQVRQDVEAGGSFHEALANYPKTFSEIFVNLVMAGEMSGNLSKVLEQYSIYLEKTVVLRRKIKSAVSYPIVIISIALLMVVGVIWKLVPIFKATYDDFGVKLPLPTQILININNVARDHFLLFLFIAAGISAGFIAIGKTVKGRLFFDTFKLNMPIFGSLLTYATMARFARTLSVLVGSGVPILQSLDICATISGNRLIEKAINKSQLAIQEGVGIADAFKRTKVFPEIVLQMVDTGEQSGQLDKMLLRAAGFYDQQAEAAASALTTVLEPVLIVIVGFVIGFILIALFLPIFMLGQVFAA